MNKLRVLQLIPFASDPVIHGGKIRVSKVHSFLQNSDFLVEQFFAGDQHVAKQNTPEWIVDLPDSLASDVKLVFSEFVLPPNYAFQFDIVIFEHPWQFEQAKILRTQNPELKLIYSSHNIEWKLKQQILKPYLGEKVERVASFIRNLEYEISSFVDGIICVSSSDVEWFAEFSDVPTIVVNNASDLRKSPDNKQQTLLKNYGLIVGSAHPPNIEGCFKFINDADLWLPREYHLKIVGTLATALQDPFKGAKNIDFLNRLSNEELSSVIGSASCLILPIAYGAGTNLKTAEALVSGRPIVGSRIAFRGYEMFMDSDNVTVTDDPFTFKRAVLNYLHQWRPDTIRKFSENLNWDYALKDLPKFLMNIYLS